MSATTAKGQPVSVVLDGYDLEADPITYSIEVLPRHGWISETSNGEILAFSDPRILYTPEPGFTGVDTFTYSVNDGKSSSYQATVRVTVLPSTVVERFPESRPVRFVNVHGVDVFSAAGRRVGPRSPVIRIPRR